MLNSLEKVLGSPWCSQFHLSSSSLYAICSHSRSSVKFLYSRIPKNTESDFSSTYSPCQQRRKPLGTGYPSDHLGIVILSMRARKYRSQLHATWRFRVFQFIPPAGAILSPFTFFIAKILPNSHIVMLSLTFCPLRMSIITWCDQSRA